MLKFQALKPLLRRAHRALILCHQNADPDAVSSAIALSRLLLRLNRRLNVELAASKGVSDTSKRVLRWVPTDFTDKPNIESADIIFMVDTSTLQQLAEWKKRISLSKKPIVVIDHHYPHPATRRIARLMLTDEKAMSTCELVHQMYRSFGLKPSKGEAFALFAGMVFETKHFAIATSETFTLAAELVELGVNPREAIAMLRGPMTYSERIARLKAAQRLVIKRLGQWLVATSVVSSYQASVARALLMLGAHAAVVGGEKGGNLRISLRSTDEFYKKTRIHLGKDVARPIGDSIGGMGGGHALAAGVNGAGDVGSALAGCLERIADKLKSNMDL